MERDVTVIGICGGSGAGKSTLVAQLLDRLGPHRTTAISFDIFYHDLSHLPHVERAGRNYDHPSALDVDDFVENLDRLRRHEPAQLPRYDFANHTRLAERDHVEPAPIVIADGILLLHFPQIRDRLDHMVFVDVPTSIRFERRLHRDVAERGRDVESVHRQFEATVRPMHDTYVQPSAAHADLVVRHGDDRSTTLDTINELMAVPSPLR